MLAILLELSRCAEAAPLLLRTLSDTYARTRPQAPNSPRLPVPSHAQFLTYETLEIRRLLSAFEAVALPLHQFGLVHRQVPVIDFENV